MISCLLLTLAKDTQGTPVRQGFKPASIEFSLFGAKGNRRLSAESIDVFENAKRFLGKSGGGTVGPTGKGVRPAVDLPGIVLLSDHVVAPGQMDGQTDLLRIGCERPILLHVGSDDDVVFACFLEAAEFFQAVGEGYPQEHGPFIGDSEVLIRYVVEMLAITKLLVVIAFDKEDVGMEAEGIDIELPRVIIPLTDRRLENIITHFLSFFDLSILQIRPAEGDICF